MPPACARVVPRAEYTTVGAGESPANWAAHFVVSASMVALSFADASVLGARREMVYTVLQASRWRSVARIWWPTRPVEPMTAVTDVIATILFVSWRRGWGV